MTLNARHLSLSGAWMTPLPYIEASRQTLGHIYRDPCGSELSNTRVKASYLNTREDSGLSPENRDWGSTLLVNAPGTCKLVDEHGVVSFPGCGTFLDNGKPRQSCSCQLVKQFWENLVRCWMEGWVEGFVWVGFSLEQLQSLQDVAPLSPLDFPLCFPRKRVKYDLPGGASKSPPHSSFFAYGGPRPEVFKAVFSRFGRVK
jgi:hypothetical protein